MSVISSVMRHAGADGLRVQRLAASDPADMGAFAFRWRGDSVDWMPATCIGAAGTGFRRTWAALSLRQNAAAGLQLSWLANLAVFVHWARCCNLLL